MSIKIKSYYPHKKRDKYTIVDKDLILFAIAVIALLATGL